MNYPQQKLRWQLGRCIQRQNILRPLQDWLFDPSSMSVKLRALNNNTLTVKVLTQRWLSPYVDEAKLLGITPRRVALVREVVLYGNEQPYVYGRSVFPAQTISGRRGCLGYKLGQGSLGDLLFTDPTIMRSEFEIAQLPSKHEQYPAINDFFNSDMTTTWGRRSLFFYRQQPLLVTEIFLPALHALFSNSSDND